MRYYGFANFMLSSIQQGVQNFHVIAEMFVKYKAPSAEHLILHEWAECHKTAIFLNGGNAAGLRAVYDTLWKYCDELKLPFDKFHEDGDSLDSTMTACGIIVPSYIVDMMSIVRSTPCDWTEYEQTYPGMPNLTAIEFAMYLNEFGLAR